MQWWNLDVSIVHKPWPKLKNDIQADAERVRVHTCNAVFGKHWPDLIHSGKKFLVHHVLNWYCDIKSHCEMAGNLLCSTDHENDMELLATPRIWLYMIMVRVWRPSEHWRPCTYHEHEGNLTYRLLHTKAHHSLRSALSTRVLWIWHVCRPSLRKLLARAGHQIWHHGM